MSRCASETRGTDGNAVLTSPISTRNRSERTLNRYLGLKLRLSTRYMTAVSSATAGTISFNITGSLRERDRDLRLWSKHTVQELGKLNGMASGRIDTDA